MPPSIGTAAGYWATGCTGDAVHRQEGTEAIGGWGWTDKAKQYERSCPSLSINIQTQRPLRHTETQAYDHNNHMGKGAVGDRLWHCPQMYCGGGGGGGNVSATTSRVHQRGLTPTGQRGKAPQTVAWSSTSLVRMASHGGHRGRAGGGGGGGLATDDIRESGRCRLPRAKASCGSNKVCGTTAGHTEHYSNPKQSRSDPTTTNTNQIRGAMAINWVVYQCSPRCFMSQTRVMCGLPPCAHAMNG